jgi:murein DD-endopeptidase MepM/ murein hydrolase activator NlpD
VILLLLAAVLSALRTLTAQAPPPILSIHTIPTAPVRGSLALVVISIADSMGPPLAIEGDAAGEPLHFQTSGRGYRAFAAAPLEDSDSLAITIVASWRNRMDTVRRVLPVFTPKYPSERLRVAPRFAVLDSATQARVDSEVARAREVGHRSHGGPPLWRGAFSAPRPGRVTSVFGTEREFNGEITSRHYGTDFAGKTGAPVRAAGRGVVALVGDLYLAGHAVYLDHGAGLVTGYFHLSRVDVAVGDTVTTGEIIGGVGMSGRATGPHLHWIARYGAITIDPMSLIRQTRSAREP